MARTLHDDAPILLDELRTLVPTVNMDGPGLWGSEWERLEAVALFETFYPLEAVQADVFDTVWTFITRHGIPVSDLYVDSMCRRVIDLYGPVGVAELAYGALTMLYPAIMRRLDMLTGTMREIRPFNGRTPNARSGFTPDPDDEAASIRYGLNRLYDDAQREAKQEATGVSWSYIRGLIDEEARLTLLGGRTITVDGVRVKDPGYNVNPSNICHRCNMARSTSGACDCD